MSRSPGTGERPQAGQGEGRGSHRDEVDVPREHEPRDPHADERHHRPVAPRPEDAAQRQAARLREQGPQRRHVAAGDHQRHPRFLEDRGGQARHRDHRLQARRRHQLGRRRSPAQKAHDKGLEFLADVSRSIPAAAAWAIRCGWGRSSPTWSTTRSSSPSAARSASRSSCSSRPARRCSSKFSVRDTGIGMTPGAGGEAVPAVHAGRHVDHAQVRRHRAGPDDLPAAGRADGRADLARERAGRGQHLHFTVWLERRRGGRRAGAWSRTAPGAARAGRGRQCGRPRDPGRRRSSSADRRRWTRSASGAEAIAAVRRARRGDALRRRLHGLADARHGRAARRRASSRTTRRSASSRRSSW